MAPLTHYVDDADLPCRIAHALCGRFVGRTERSPEPTCEGCQRVLAERAAVDQQIAAGLVDKGWIA